MLSSKRHNTAKKSFEDLTFEEQNHAMNRNALQFRRQLTAHVRKAKAEGRCTKELLNGRLRLFDRIFRHYTHELEVPASERRA